MVFETCCDYSFGQCVYQKNHGQLTMLLPCFVTFILTLAYVTFHSEQSQCPKTTLKPPTPLTKCVAGRRLYTNWSFFKIPGDEAGLQQVIPPSWLAVITTDYAGVKSLCSGTLINDRYVLTAQRCVSPPLEPQHISVGLGNGNYPPSKLILHPDFDHTTPETAINDIALLRLALPLRFTRKLLPLQLATQNYVLDLKKSTIFAFSQIETNVFRNEFVTLQGLLMRQNDCRNFNDYYQAFVKKQLICFKDGADSKDCINLRGIMGAALTIENEKRIYRIDVLIGVLSWWWPKNRPCMALENPLVFVNVQEKLPWILNNTTDALYCRY